MAQRIVKFLDDKIVKHFRRRAAQSGRWTEAERREILLQVLLLNKREKSLKERLLDMPNVGRDEDFVRIQDQSGSARPLSRQ